MASRSLRHSGLIDDGGLTERTRAREIEIVANVQTANYELHVWNAMHAGHLAWDNASLISERGIAVTTIRLRILLQRSLDTHDVCPDEDWQWSE
eukprot:IDg16208t1